jgi:hypothetical protein
MKSVAQWRCALIVNDSDSPYVSHSTALQPSVSLSCATPAKHHTTTATTTEISFGGSSKQRRIQSIECTLQQFEGEV